MIQIDDLSLFYHGIPVFEEVSFTINSGERCGFVGRNRSGKTSLMRLLVGQEKQDSGVISFPRGYKLGYLDQHIRFTSLTVLDEAVLGLKEEEKEFKAIDQENTIEGRDGEMAIEDEKAKFIKERVLVLINKIETIR